jgi:hypothetical protein
LRPGGFYDNIKIRKRRIQNEILLFCGGKIYGISDETLMQFRVIIGMKGSGNLLTGCRNKENL